MRGNVILGIARKRRGHWAARVISLVSCCRLRLTSGVTIDRYFSERRHGLCVPCPVSARKTARPASPMRTVPAERPHSCVLASGAARRRHPAADPDSIRPVSRIRVDQPHSKDLIARRQATDLHELVWPHGIAAPLGRGASACVRLRIAIDAVSPFGRRPADVQVELGRKVWSCGSSTCFPWRSRSRSSRESASGASATRHRWRRQASHHDPSNNNVSTEPTSSVAPGSVRGLVRESTGFRNPQCTVQPRPDPGFPGDRRLVQRNTTFPSLWQCTKCDAKREAVRPPKKS